MVLGTGGAALRRSKSWQKPTVTRSCWTNKSNQSARVSDALADWALLVAACVFTLSCRCRELADRAKDVMQRQAQKSSLTETKIREKLDRADSVHKSHIAEIRRKAVSENMKVSALFSWNDGRCCSERAVTLWVQRGLHWCAGERGGVH